MIALLNGQHGAEDFIARLAPLGYEGAISDFLTDQVVKLHRHRQVLVACADWATLVRQVLAVMQHGGVCTRYLAPREAECLCS